MFSQFSLILAGLAFFFGGLAGAKVGFRTLATPGMRRITQRITSHPLLAASWGLVSGAITQSATGVGFILTGLVAAGAMIDLATGGISMGGFTALGAAGAALGAVGASGGKMLRRLRGQDEVRLADSGIDVLALRARATILAFLARGHAAIEPVSLENVIEDGLRDDGRSDDDPKGSTWPELRRRARGVAAWSGLSHPRSTRGPGVARAEAALRIEEWLQRNILPPS